jgi:hypothetical protein
MYWQHHALYTDSIRTADLFKRVSCLGKFYVNPVFHVSDAYKLAEQIIDVTLSPGRFAHASFKNRELEPLLLLAPFFERNRRPVKKKIPTSDDVQWGG